MILKEQFKAFQLELEENLEVLKVPKYMWHWKDGLLATLWILSITHYQYSSRAFKTWKLAKEIYG